MTSTTKANIAHTRPSRALTEAHHHLIPLTLSSKATEDLPPATTTNMVNSRMIRTAATRPTLLSNSLMARRLSRATVNKGTHNTSRASMANLELQEVPADPKIAVLDRL